MSYSSEVLADSPAAYYRLAETSGTTLVDSSGNARNGTYSGSPTLGAAGLLTGDSNLAVSFDGTNDYALTASGAWTTTTAVTIEAIVSFTGTATGQVVYRASGWGFRLGLDGTVYVNAVMSSLNTGVTITKGQATHLALTYDNTTARLYKGGTQVWTYALGGGGSTGTAAYYIGSEGGAGFYYKGVIDEVAIYNTTLSAARISAHATAMTTSPSSSNVTLGGTLPTLGGSMSLEATPAASLMGMLPALAGSFDLLTAPPIIGTDTTYANDGYNYDGIADVVDEPPVAAPPPGVPHPVVVKRVHQSMPAPTLVNGRPT